jgi:hypothetical protein
MTTSFERAYQGVIDRVATGDITKQEVDAIVNPARNICFKAICWIH